MKYTRILSIVFLILAATSANADIIRIDFTGTSTSSTGVFASEVVPDGQVTGSVYLDTRFPVFPDALTVGSEGLSGSHSKDTAPYMAALGIEIQFGNQTHSTVSNSGQSGITVNLYDAGSFSRFSYRVSTGTTGDDRGTFTLEGNGLVTTPVPDSITYDLINGLSLQAILNDIQGGNPFAEAGGSYVAIDSNDSELGLLEWDITSVKTTLVPVPIPAGIWLFSLGLAMLVGVSCR